MAESLNSRGVWDLGGRFWKTILSTFFYFSSNNFLYYTPKSQSPRSKDLVRILTGWCFFWDFKTQVSGKGVGKKNDGVFYSSERANVSP